MKREMNSWISFKFELISVRKKSYQLKENLSRNKLKPDINATEWLLKQICGANNINEYPVVTSIAKIALIIPVSNVCSEVDRRAIKQIKTNKWRTLKSDAPNLFVQNVPFLYMLKIVVFWGYWKGALQMNGLIHWL